jgi:hypothetical protein
MACWLNIYISFALLSFLVILHEYIHYYVMRKQGYGGKLVFVKKQLGIGIKPIGIHDNIIGAKDIQVVLFAPVFPTVILFITSFSLVIGKFNIYGFIFGIIFALLCCLSDLINIFKIKYWWNKSIKKNLCIR